MIGNMEKHLNKNLDEHQPFKNFIGQLVELLCKFKVDNEEHTFPMLVQGYLIDYDDDNYYIGSSPIEIDQFVDRSIVVHGSLIKSLDPAKEILENMPEPETDIDVN